MTIDSGLRARQRPIGPPLEIYTYSSITAVISTTVAAVRAAAVLRRVASFWASTDRSARTGGRRTSSGRTSAYARTAAVGVIRRTTLRTRSSPVPVTVSTLRPGRSTLGS